MSKLKPYFWTFFLAFVILTYGFIIKKDIAWYYLGNSETVYKYLLNGLTLASGHSDLGTLSHPGILLVLLYALIIKIIGWFRPSQISIDVLDNPELYLSVIATVFIVGVSVLLFWLLSKIQKINQYRTSFLFLTLLLIPASLFTQLPYPNPYILVSTLFLAQLVLALNNENKKRYPIHSGILSGLSIAALYASWPIILFHLIVLKGKKNKFRYIISLIIILLMILAPWLKSIVTGNEWLPVFLENGLLKPDATSSIVLFFIKNFQLNLFSDGLVLLCLIISTLLYLFNKNIKTKILGGSIITAWTGILVTSAFFSIETLLPFQVIAVFSLFLVIKEIDKTTKLNALISSQGWFFLIFLLFFVLFYRNIKQHPFQFAQKYQRFNTITFLDNKHDLETILVLNEKTPTPVQEFALYTGYTQCKGYAKDNYQMDLANLYPNIVFYTAENGLFDWNGSLSIPLYLNNNNNGLIYRQKNDSTDILKIPLFKEFDAKMVFSNHFNNEEIYAYQFSNSELLLDSVISCDFERFNNENIFDATQTIDFGSDSKQIDNGIAFEGTHSLLLTPENPFALTHTIKILEQLCVEITVWRKSEEQRGLIVVQDDDNEFYQTSSRVIKKVEEWEKLQITFDVQDHLKTKNLKLYCWNNGEKNVWFDELRIKYFTALP